jgi:hypothetical protein
VSDGTTYVVWYISCHRKEYHNDCLKATKIISLKCKTADITVDKTGNEKLWKLRIYS